MKAVNPTRIKYLHCETHRAGPFVYTSARIPLNKLLAHYYGIYNSGSTVCLGLTVQRWNWEPDSHRLFIGYEAELRGYPAFSSSTLVLSFPSLQGKYDIYEVIKS
jgi:hypothetical protein